MPQATASQLTCGSIPRSSKILSPAARRSCSQPCSLQFCPELSQQSIPSYLKILIQAVPRFCPQLGQGPVPGYVFFLLLFFSISLNSLFLFQIPPQLSMHPDPGELWPLGCGLLGPDKSGVIRKDWGHWMQLPLAAERLVRSLRD